MRLFQRINDIITANLNEMIARFENPETMLRQAVREMDDAVSDVMDRAARVIAQEKLLDRQLREHRARVSHWQGRAEQAVTRMDDLAARDALRRKHEHERIAEALADQLQTTQQASLRLRRQLEALRSIQSDARRRVAILSARQRVAETQRQMSRLTASERLEISAQSRFEHWSEQIEYQEAHSTALWELSGHEPLGFGEDETSADIEAELEQLKRTIVKERAE